MKHNLFLTFILLATSLSFSACDNYSKKYISKDNNDCFNLPIPEEISPIINGEFLDSITPIPLETKAQCQIGNICKFKVINGKIYVLDDSQNSLFIFDSKGNFLNKISKQGHGPGEYLKLCDFLIDNNIIEILGYKKIIKFNLNGNYIDEIDLNVLSRAFVKTLNDNYYIWTGEQTDKKTNGTINYISSDGKLINKFFDWDGNGRLITSYNMFTKSNNGILLHPFKYDYILREIDDNGIKDKYLVNFGNYSYENVEMLNDLIANNHLTGRDANGEKISFGKKAYSISEVYETKDYIIFNFKVYQMGSYIKYYIYSKQMNKSKIILKENQHSTLPFSFYTINYADQNTNTVYNYCPAYYLKKVMKKKYKTIENSNKWNEIKILLQNINYDSNPVIFKSKIKAKLFN